MKHTEYIVPIGEKAEDYDEIFIGVIRKHSELIRCKDCTAWKRKESYATIGSCAMWHCGRSRSDYCSEAMRKEE